MARTLLTREGMRRAIAFSERLYALFLYVYPATFRSAYGSRMARIFRDSCRDALQRHGLRGLIPLWLHTVSDLLINAWLERWQVLKEKTRIMLTDKATQRSPLRLWAALAATLIAFTVSLLASLNLYLLEDTSHLTQAAYSASPLLRLSYDSIYLSALVAGVAVCAIIGYAVVQRTILVVAGLIIVAVFVVLGGFGGLLVRHTTTFLVFFAVFLALLLLCMLVGRAVAKRVAGNFPGERSAAVLGACVSTASALLINLAALVMHTLILNPVSHALYMQGQIGGTHWNFSLLAMGIALLSMIACLVGLGLALRLPVQRS